MHQAPVRRALAISRGIAGSECVFKSENRTMKLAEFRKLARALEAEPDGERRAELAKQLYERFGRSWIE